ncbi:MAG: hypothetical protein JOY54_18400 [Acidobacteriaceae bacterium]|nr:hypothetical protein [Acidobacteriaceae bacterium]
MRYRLKSFIALAALSSLCALAQEPTPPGQDTGSNTLTTLAGDFAQGNFVNFYAFVDAVHDSDQVTLNNSGVGSWGVSVGGGVDLFHQFETSVVSLSYRGDYRNYGSTSFGGGSDQNLNFVFTKRVGPRWVLSTHASAGEYFYGTPYYNYQQNGPLTPASNPFSNETRYLSGGVSAVYRQTRRLSYILSGQFYLTRYSYANAIGSNGGSGSAGISYNFTARTSLTASYVHNNFQYEQNSGSALIDSAFLTVQHKFSRRTTASISGGVARAHSQGTITEQALLLVNGQPPLGSVTGPYNVVSWIPSFQGNVSHNWRRLTATATGGQVVVPGNGIYLTSRNLYLSGTIARNWGRLHVGGGGGYYHIVSISNARNSTYNSVSLSATASYMLMRYIGAHATYNYYLNGSYGAYSNVADNRIAFGLNFSSKGIPLTLF